MTLRRLALCHSPDATIASPASAFGSETLPSHGLFFPSTPRSLPPLRLAVSSVGAHIRAAVTIRSCRSSLTARRSHFGDVPDGAAPLAATAHAQVHFSSYRLPWTSSRLNAVHCQSSTSREPLRQSLLTVKALYGHGSM